MVTEILRLCLANCLRIFLLSLLLSPHVLFWHVGCVVVVPLFRTTTMLAMLVMFPACAPFSEFRTSTH